MDNFNANLVGVLENIGRYLERIATAQEHLLAIAAEAREERLKLSAELKRNLTAGFQGGHADGR